MLVPRVEAKDLADAGPGELVRTAGRNGPILGLVAKRHIGADAKLLICLTPPDEENPAPCYMSIGAQSGTALSFGKDYIIVGNPAAEAIDPHWHGEFYAAGALIVTGARTVLQVAPMRHAYHGGHVLYAIDTGSTVSDATPPGCVLLKWEIRLKPVPELDPPLPPIFRFEAQSRSGR